jgi:hypothetical protein
VVYRFQGAVEALRTNAPALPVERDGKVELARLRYASRAGARAPEWFTRLHSLFRTGSQENTPTGADQKHCSGRCWRSWAVTERIAESSERANPTRFVNPQDTARRYEGSISGSTGHRRGGGPL